MTFAIGMYQPKDERNMGSLIRSADLFGAEYVFQIGGTPYRHAATDTAKSATRVPVRYYEDLRDFRVWIPHPERRMTLVAVELDTHSVPLSRFTHPVDAAYLLGSENRGIPRDVLDLIGSIVQVETAKSWPLNVATAGSIVMHSRFTQQMGTAA